MKCPYCNIEITSDSRGNSRCPGCNYVPPRLSDASGPPSPLAAAAAAAARSATATATAIMSPAVMAPAVLLSRLADIAPRHGSTLAPSIDRLSTVLHVNAASDPEIALTIAFPEPRPVRLDTKVEIDATVRSIGIFGPGPGANTRLNARVCQVQDGGTIVTCAVTIPDRLLTNFVRHELTLQGAIWGHDPSTWQVQGPSSTEAVASDEAPCELLDGNKRKHEDDAENSQAKRARVSSAPPQVFPLAFDQAVTVVLQRVITMVTPSSLQAQTFSIEVANQMPIVVRESAAAQLAVTRRHFAQPRSAAALRLNAAVTPGDAAHTQWTVNGRVLAVGATLDIPCTEPARLVVTGTHAAGADTIVVWIYWAEIDQQFSGTLPADCELNFKDAVCGVKENTNDPSNRQLGIMTTPGADPNTKQATGRMIAFAHLYPDGIEDVFPRGWKLHREISEEVTWYDKYATRRDPKVQKKSKKNKKDNPSPGTGMAQQNPTALHRIYIGDGPNIARFYNAEYFVETYMNFRQWVTLNGVVISDNAEWHLAGVWLAHGGEGNPAASVEVGTESYAPWCKVIMDRGPIAIPDAESFVFRVAGDKVYIGQKPGGRW